ncbi:RDD family protein [Mycolicibacterium aurum]|nr:RDD family protein [Mycolicibacterium aurum]
MHDVRLPRAAYTPWLVRVVASVIDLIPVAVVWGLWEAVTIAGATTDCVTYDNGGVVCTATSSPVNDLGFALAVVLTVGYLIWNFGHRQGAVGSSIGKSAMKFQVVDQKTWRPVGFATSLLRQAVHLVDAILCFVGFLVPLWDARRQTLADKLMNTVCVPRRPGRA